jgi:hypothetical protein
VVIIGQYNEGPIVLHIYTFKLGWQLMYAEGEKQDKHLTEFATGGFLAHGFTEYYSASYGFDGLSHNRVLLACSSPEEVCLERFGAKPKALTKRRIRHGLP